jgi:hypothetical protein
MGGQPVSVPFPGRRKHPRRRPFGIAEVTATCDKNIPDVIFRALIVDENGSPTIDIVNDPEDDLFKGAFDARYKLDDRLGVAVLFRPKYKNEVLMFFATTAKAAKNIAGGDDENPVGPILSRAYLALLTAGGKLSAVNQYKSVHRVMAEVKTTRGDLVITLPLDDFAIQQVYQLCFDGND